MKLDRLTTPSGRGKYAIINLRQFPSHKVPTNTEETHCVIPADAVDYGTDPDREFFVIRLKDRFAHSALAHYSHAIRARIEALDKAIIALNMVDRPAEARAVMVEQNELHSYLGGIEKMVERAFHMHDTKNPD